jgi:hypothetical protein
MCVEPCNREEHYLFYTAIYMLSKAKLNEEKFET